MVMPTGVLRSLRSAATVLGLCAVVATGSPVTAQAAISAVQQVRRAPAGSPVGTATMKVLGSADGPVSISYRINGGPQQTESNVTLPWEKNYPVYDEVETSVTADAGDATLSCTITMDGMLAAFKTEARPTCSFAYYG
ncbi:hypothetical protein [Mycolicibacter heraklionensis]|uniref:hypothetical protein n=1 Tax=Mycolicibacter heraklionensis TaxID=512402 RepID=UPI0009ED8AC1|nr:hypothetical protein [Mycolicibacter heraklionensis]